jgi:hypothetical protein
MMEGRATNSPVAGDRRLLVLTLPHGKGLLCSYTIREGEIELAYPHTTSCHRGSGYIVYLRRPAE